MSRIIYYGAGLMIAQVPAHPPSDIFKSGIDVAGTPAEHHQPRFVSARGAIRGETSRQRAVEGERLRRPCPGPRWSRGQAVHRGARCEIPTARG